VSGNGSGEIRADSSVTLRYRLSLADGTVVEASGDAPETLHMGRGEMVDGLEERLVGLHPGDRQTMMIPAADEVFGAYDEVNHHPLRRAEFGDQALVEGQVVEFTLPNGQTLAGTILSFDDDSVEVDFNHPLAGRDLVFEVEIIAVELG